MIVFHRNSTKRITLFLPSKPSRDLENPSWIEDNDEETIQHVLTLEKSYNFRKNTEDDLIFTFITYPHTIIHPTACPHTVSHQNYPSLGHILRSYSQETCSFVELEQQFYFVIPLDDISQNHITLVETHPRKTLNVISKLEPSQQYQLINMLQKHNSAFS
jgi:hypothetical protein